MKTLTINNKSYEIEDSIADLILMISKERDKLKETLNPTEAVYGFAAWLTCRKEKTIMSASDDSAIIADLVKQFCEVNNLPEVSEHWPQYLIHPEGEVAVPEIGKNK